MMKLIKIILIIGVLYYGGMKGYEWMNAEGYFESKSTATLRGEVETPEKLRDTPL